MQNNKKNSKNKRACHYHEKSSSLGLWFWSPSIMSTLNTNSLVSRAISKAIGGSDWFQALHCRSPSSSSRPSSAIALPACPASKRRCLSVDSFLTIGSLWFLNAVVDDIAVSVDCTTVPITSAMALICVSIAVIPPSERMDDTRDWIFCTNRAVWSSR